MKLTYVVILIGAVVAGVGARFVFRGDLAEPVSGNDRPPIYTPNCVVANGVTEGASLEVETRPEIMGRVSAILVREQQDVAAGQVLVELDSAAQKHQLALAVAQLAQAEANLEKVRAGERAEKRRAVAAAEAAQRVKLQHAQADYQRAKDLLPSNSISRSEYDMHYFKMLEAEATWKQAKAELELIEAPARREDVALAEAEVAAAKAKVEQARTELAKTRLLAPFAGRVLRVYAERGELVGPHSAEPVLLFADVSKRRVRAYVEELDCDRVRVGQTAFITADGLPGKSFRGKVVQVFPRMGKHAPRSNAPGEYHDVYFREVLILVNTQEELPINLRVEVRIEAGAGGGQNISGDSGEGASVKSEQVSNVSVPR